MESELKIGRDIQMSMSPQPLPGREDLDIAASIVPAKQVGGDLYDYYIRDQKLVFCIGDVSGKGVPASLVMAVTRSLFRNISAMEDNPALIVSGVNSSLIDNMSENEMFVTFFCGVLDLSNGHLSYCNAGHNAPLLFTDHIEPLDVVPNLPLGIMDGMVFEGQQLELHYDDALYLYTDGVTEAENMNHEQFGIERLETVLHERRPACEHLDAVKNAVSEFVDEAPQSDDITMLFIHYLNDNTQPAIMARHLILHNNIQQIPQLAEFVETIAEEKNLDQAMAMSLNLALEEAVTNVILYAYPDGIDGLVDIEAFIHIDCLEFIISDSGKPFDPTAAPEADVTLGVDERKIGGLGIYLVRNIMDTVSYRYEKGKNILTMIKKI
jgi:sigma-B regulation protein RsbU (phosphoserine phosphatase)